MYIVLPRRFWNDLRSFTLLIVPVLFPLSQNVCSLQRCKDLQCVFISCHLEKNIFKTLTFRQLCSFWFEYFWRAHKAGGANIVINLLFWLKASWSLLLKKKYSRAARSKPAQRTTGAKRCRRETCLNTTVRIVQLQLPTSLFDPSYNTEQSLC